MNLEQLQKKFIFKMINFWPPFLGAGVKVRTMNGKRTSFEVSMSLSLRNKNYVGTHFGGNLYSMCDPWYMIILLEELGRDYLVWDKAATINFKKPGKGRVRALFEIDSSRVEEIRKAVDGGEKHEPVFEVQILDEGDQVVAIVEKKLWVKKKIASQTPS